MSADNRRVHERLPAIIRVNYESAGAMRSDYVQNISRGGLFVATDEPFEIGQHIVLQLVSPGSRQGVPVPCEIRWVGARGAPPVRGIGVQFDLADPVTRTRVEQMVNAVFDPIPPSVTGERLNVLLVDPNKHAARMFADGLRSMAERTFDLTDLMHVVEAHDGLTALGLLQSSRFALAIIELRTPEVDGVELIRRIRTEISQSMPVFAMARAYPGDRHEALSAGADAFMHKPIQLRALFNSVKVMLNLQDSEAA